MEKVYRCKDSGTTVYLIRGLGRERDQAEEEVANAGIPMPLAYRSAWAANVPRSEAMFLLARDVDGRACAGIAVEQVRTRALPGHTILRVRRFGNRLPIETCKVVLEAIGELTRKFPRILQVQVQVFSRDCCANFSQVFSALGYREIIPPSVYRHTLVMDLTPTEDEIFAKINQSGRQNIRKALKLSLQSVPITDEIYADRIRELQQEALQRTHGHIASEDWHAVLKMSKERPDLSCVFGLFNGEAKSPADMVAFGWVCNHGDHGEYKAAGSTRSPGVKIPYGYLVVWDLIRWSKAGGADWFDLGGVTLNEGDEDPLKGISDFKRCFRGEVAEVGSEWFFDRHPVRAQLANTMSQNLQRLRGWMNRKSS